MRIYIASPLFTLAERVFNEELKTHLVHAGHEVFLPQEHEPRPAPPAAIFEIDLQGLEWADVVVANMDGSDPDSGTSWECGFVFNKKPVIAFRTDFRRAGDSEFGPYNLMLLLSASKVLDLPLATMAELADAIMHALPAVGIDAQTRRTGS